MEKKTNKAKLQIFKLSENRLNRKVIAFDKFSWNCVLHGNSINIHLLEYLCKQNLYLQWKQCKILLFSWKHKNHRKSFLFVNCLRFSLKLLSRLLQKVIKYYFLNRKEDKYTKSEIFTFLRKSAESQGYSLW